MWRLTRELDQIILSTVEHGEVTFRGRIEIVFVMSFHRARSQLNTTYCIFTNCEKWEWHSFCMQLILFASLQWCDVKKVFETLKILTDWIKCQRLAFDLRAFIMSSSDVHDFRSYLFCNRNWLRWWYTVCMLCASDIKWQYDDARRGNDTTHDSLSIVDIHRSARQVHDSALTTIFDWLLRKWYICELHQIAMLRNDHLRAIIELEKA